MLLLLQFWYKCIEHTGGVSLNGSANINLPGVNAAGNQDTTGNAATATVLEAARTIGGVSFNGSADIDLPGVNAAGNQDTTGNAATATTATAAATVTTAAQPNITTLARLLHLLELVVQIHLC